MDSLPIFELHKICRICLKNDLLVSIFSPTFLIRPIEMIGKLNIFQYNPDDGLPTLLCQACLYRLVDAYNLQQLSETSENRLRDYLLNTAWNESCSITNLPTAYIPSANQNSHEFSCYSTSANSSQEDPESAAGIYANIYDIFEPHASNDIEVEDDVLNDVVIDVSSLTRSEAEEEDSLNFLNTTEVQGNCLPSTQDNNDNLNKQIYPDKKSLTEALTNSEKCAECGKTFSYSGYLEIHMRTHSGVKPFKCKLCSKEFTQSGNLLLHMRTHTGERRFQCELCASFFTTSSNLKAHKLTHTERREYACTQCSLRFKTPRELKKHEPVHKTTKDIHCALCQKAFTKSSYLSAHMSAVHRGIRKHSCTECQRVFGSRSNLVCHMRIHNGEKPFQCKHCPWKFNQSSALVRHMKKHVPQQSCSNTIPKVNNDEAIITDYLGNSKMEHLQGEIAMPPHESEPLKEQQTELANINTLSPLSTTGFTLSDTASLQAYDFTNSQQQSGNIY